MPRKNKDKMTPEKLEKIKTYYREYQRKRKKNLSQDELLKFKEKIKEANKKYKENNKELLKEKRKEYVDKNRDKIKKGWDKWYEKNKEKVIKKMKDYTKSNLDKINERKRQRKKIDPLYKLTENIRRLINSAIKRKNFKKNTKTINILGCTPIELQKHIESKFESWMNWENYGLYNGELNYGWDIDHIIPNNSAKTYEDIIKLNHYTNLQPLCSRVNRDIKRYK